MFSCHRGRRGSRGGETRWHWRTRREWGHFECSGGRAQEGRGDEECCIVGVTGFLCMFSLEISISAATISEFAIPIHHA